MSTRNGDNGSDEGWDFAEARRNFETVWAPSSWRFRPADVTEPSIAELLGVDREYRTRVVSASAADRPALRIRRDGREYLAQFVRSRDTDRVTLLVDGMTPGRRYSIVTVRDGLLTGRRVVRGREADSLQYYLSLRS